MKKLSWRILPLLSFFVLAFFLWKGLFMNPKLLPSVQIGKSLPRFDLPLLDKPTEHFNNAMLSNQVVLLNVWASWCSACVEEQPFLLHLSQTGVHLFGVNYKDTHDDANDWLKQWGNPYLAIAEDRFGKLAMDLGVYGAPETFLVDKQGIIRLRHVGPITEEVWAKEIAPAMHHWEQVS